MASYPLSYLGMQLLAAPKEFLQRFPNPWLVWSSGAIEEKRIVAPTRVMTETDLGNFPDEGWMAVELVKGGQPNGFPFGVTIGRTENNDVVLRHAEVSRVHAYVQQVKAHLCLVDADSTNGTFLDGRRLVASRPEPLDEMARVGLGKLVVLYFSPSKFLEYLKDQVMGPGHS